MEFQALAPLTGLRSVLAADREQRIAQGWAAGEIGRVAASYFATLTGARYYVGIEVLDPRLPHKPPRWP
ncbi:MAG: hypothetical protein JSR67_12965 [Proteobacteria bacterium]|nr:hypothetical protein [Pseudomonadota bacterium]